MMLGIRSDNVFEDNVDKDNIDGIVNENVDDDHGVEMIMLLTHICLCLRLCLSCNDHITFGYTRAGDVADALDA
ncbi:uncharacterized protein HKW66_Vig0118530 [Vigna angularis]|uniref:Uncharacterized protein n=1 Tax=Phaseolus angularis TaxID=3914 RepID=A0A8T0JYQ2_PHAAN|nr:uncharacterized protein HKW66_Vig0118530 [Vigna angularis]